MTSTEFNWKTHPNMPVYLAVKLSMSVPFFFQPTEYQGSMYIDGAMLDNFPLDYFDNKKEGKIDKNTIGLMLCAHEEMDPTYVPQFPRETFKEYLITLLSGMSTKASEAHFRIEETKEFKLRRIIKLDTLDVQTLDFQLSDEKKVALIQSGYECTHKFFTDIEERLKLAKCETKV